MTCLANYYYDVSKCGVGWHGDDGSRRVIGVRIGKSTDLAYNWFYKGKPIGDRFKVTLNNGDLYIMSEKSVGSDHKNRDIVTIKHAAGAEWYLSLDKFREKKSNFTANKEEQKKSENEHGSMFKMKDSSKKVAAKEEEKLTPPKIIYKEKVISNDRV